MNAFGWSSVSKAYLTDAHEEISGWYKPPENFYGEHFGADSIKNVEQGNMSNILYSYSDEGARAGVVPKSYQIELFLTSGCNVTNSEVYHVNFKPSEIAPESNKTLTLNRKYNTDWTIHNAGTCVAQPNRYLGDAKFDSFSTQEEAYISWSSFCTPTGWYDGIISPVNLRYYTPSPYLANFDGKFKLYGVS